MTTYRDILLAQLKQYQIPKSAAEIATDLSTPENTWKDKRVQSGIHALGQQGHIIRKFQTNKTRTYMYESYKPITPKVTEIPKSNVVLLTCITTYFCMFILGLGLGYAWAYTVFN